MMGRFMEETDPMFTNQPISPTHEPRYDIDPLATATATTTFGGNHSNTDTDNNAVETIKREVNDDYTNDQNARTHHYQQQQQQQQNDRNSPSSRTFNMSLDPNKRQSKQLTTSSSSSSDLRTGTSSNHGTRISTAN